MNILTNLRKYKKAINDSNRKVISLHQLSLLSNVTEERIQDDLVLFDPLLRMKEKYNYRSLIDDIEKYIADSKPVKVKTKHTKKATKAPIYENTMDYFNNNLVLIGGLINNAFVFDEDKLKELRKVVNRELKEIKEKKK